MKIETTINVPKSLGQDYKNELKKDAYVQEILKQKHLDESLVDLRLGDFSRYRKQMTYCHQCSGLSCCNSMEPGYQLSFDEKGDNELIPCPYQRKKNQLLAHQKNYLICDLSDEALQNDIHKINLEKESDNYVQIVGLVRQFIEEHNRGLYFHGPLGTGKSYLASCITNALAKEGKTVAFVNMPKLVSELKSRITEEDYVNSILRKLRRTEALVLDDIGAENLTEYIRDDILFPILDERMEKNRLTLFTSNCAIDDLKKRFAITRAGEDETKALRIIERIKTLSIEVPINGTSRRKL